MAPLWRGRLEIKRIEVDGAEVTIRGRGRTDTLTPLLGKLFPKRRKSKKGDSRVQLIHGAHLHVEGSIHYRDDSGTEVQVKRLSFVTLDEGRSPGTAPPRRFRLVLGGIRAEKSEAIAAGVDQIPAKLNLDRKIPVEELTPDGPHAVVNRKRLWQAVIMRLGAQAMQERFRRMLQKKPAAGEDEEDDE
jgi:hypothetical protein